MTLARLCRMLGIVALVIGIISFILPGEFLWSDDIITCVSTYGSLLVPGLESNPSLTVLVQKSPAFLFVVLGFLLLLLGMIKGRKEQGFSCPQK